MSVVDRVESPKTIVLKGNGHFEEGKATAAIKPGHLIKVTATEEGLPLLPPTVAVHAAQGAKVAVLVAREDALQGKTILDAYAEDDIVPYHTGLPGDILYVRVAAHSAFSPGTDLCSAGNGLFEALGGGDFALVQTREKIVSNSPSSDEQFIRVAVV